MLGLTFSSSSSAEAELHSPWGASWNVCMMTLPVQNKSNNVPWWHFLCGVFLFCRHCFERPPPGSDFYALPLPWGALQRRAYACPAWRVMSIAPAGSSRNSVHKKIRTSRSPSALRGIGDREGGWGVLSPSYQTLILCLSLSVSLSPSLLIYLCLLPSVLFSYHLLNRAQS